MQVTAIVSGEFGKLTKEEGRLFFFTICLLHLLNLCCVHYPLKKYINYFLKLRPCELCPNKAVFENIFKFENTRISFYNFFKIMKL